MAGLQLSLLGAEMIPSVTGYLQDSGYVPKGHDCNVNIFLGRNSFLHFFLPGGKSLAVKVADIGSDSAKALENEACALQKLYAIYNGLIPKFIMLGRNEDFTFLVMEGLTVSGATIDDVMSLSGSQRLTMQHLLGGEDRRIDRDINSSDNPVRILARAIEILPEGLQHKYKKIMKDREWEAFLLTMPAIPQHGDLAINNVGKTERGIIIFDWEDYGIIDIPGFDLCIMLCSSCDFKKDKLLAIIDGIYQDAENSDHFLAPIVAGLHAGQARFINLIMIHLILFHDIKCKLNYGEGVIGNIRRLLDELTN